MPRLRPPKISDDALLRKLIQLPRPTKTIAFRLQQAKEIPLKVKAISSLELMELQNKAKETKSSLDTQLLISTLTLLNGKPAFSSMEKIKSIITMTEYETLLRQVSEALDEISPTFITADYDEWIAKLKRGADHPSNWMLTHSLGGCFVPHVLGDKVLTLDHPEHFFGVPKNQLLDGHWMAYIAARFIYQQRNAP